MAKGYWLVTANISDPEGFAPYREAAGPVIAEHGGRAIVRGDVTEQVEGESHGRPFIVEFPSLDAARACYASPAYQAAIELRRDAARFDLVLAEGLEA
ncbi:MAG: DUF1330 domain-containing protein [Gaiellales bacterium]